MFLPTSVVSHGYDISKYSLVDSLIDNFVLLSMVYIGNGLGAIVSLLKYQGWDVVPVSLTKFQIY